jgi:hypothetical protein
MGLFAAFIPVLIVLAGILAIYFLATTANCIVEGNETCHWFGLFDEWRGKGGRCKKIR